MGKQWAAQWKVNSLTDLKKVYTVSVAKTGRWACDCPAHRFAKNGPDGQKQECKHITKVRLSQEIAKAVNLPMVGQVKGKPAVQPKPIRTTAVEGNIVVQTSSVLIIQTRREICMEED